MSYCIDRHTNRNRKVPQARSYEKKLGGGGGSREISWRTLKGGGLLCLFSLIFYLDLEKSSTFGSKRLNSRIYIVIWRVTSIGFCSELKEQVLKCVLLCVPHPELYSTQITGHIVFDNLLQARLIAEGTIKAYTEGEYIANGEGGFFIFLKDNRFSPRIIRTVKNVMVLVILEPKWSPNSNPLPNWASIYSDRDKSRRVWLKRKINSRFRTYRGWCPGIISIFYWSF